MNKLFLLTVCALLAVVSAKPGGDCGPPPSKKDPSECCTMPQMFDQSVKDACEAKYGSQMGGGPHGKSPCMAECLFNSTKAAVNGNVDMTVLKSYMKARLTGEWQGLIDKVLDECMAESSKMPTPPAMPAGGQQCNPMLGFMTMCSHKKAFQYCPASAYKQSAECDEMKKFAEKCAPGM